MGSLEGTLAENGGAAQAAISNGKEAPVNRSSTEIRQSDGPATTGDCGVTTRRGRSSATLEVGTRVMCRWRDGKFHPVKVIERRKLPVTVSCGGIGHDYEYYVHYTECEISFVGKFRVSWAFFCFTRVI